MVRVHAPTFAFSARIPRSSARSSSSTAARRSSRARCRSCATRQPGMMLLIALAIAVAFVASLASSWALLDLEFWWELAALIDDHAARPLAGDEGDRPGARRARGARRAAARRGRARRRDGAVETVAGRRAAPGRRRARPAGRPGSRPTATIVDGAAEIDESMITGESRPVARARRAIASSPAPSRPTRRSACASTRSARTPRSPGSSASSPRRRRSRSRAQALADRAAAVLFYVADGRGSA